MIDLRWVRIAAVAFACSVLAACGSSTPPPAGWTKTGTSTWSKDGQTYVLSTSAFGGTLTDLANNQSVSMVLSHKGLEYRGSVPYPGCEGFAGLMTFDQTAPKPGKIVLLGFMVSDSNATTVTYWRAANQPIDPAATKAMRKTICHV